MITHLKIQRTWIKGETFSLETPTIYYTKTKRGAMRRHGIGLVLLLVNIELTMTKYKQL